MKELFWSMFGSFVVGGGVCIVVDSVWDIHWNFWLVSVIVFAIYWLFRFGAGDEALSISLD